MDEETFGSGYPVIRSSFNGESIFAKLNNRNHDQPDGFHPKILAALLKTFLEGYGYSNVFSNVHNPTFYQGKTYPHHSCTVNGVASDAQKKKLVNLIRRFNELYNESSDYIEFEAKLTSETAPKPSAVPRRAVLSPSASAYVPVAAAAAAAPLQRSFASTVSAPAAAAAAVAPAAAVVAATAAQRETFKERIARLKKEQEDATAALEAAIVAEAEDNRATLRAMMLDAANRGHDFALLLSEQLKAAVQATAAAAPVSPVDPVARSATWFEVAEAAEADANKQ